MDRHHLRPLLPAESSSSTSNHSTPPSGGGNVLVRPKRSLVIVACEECRRKKTKCDAQRPACGRCVTNSLECEYEVEETAVSRFSAMKARNTTLQRENNQLKELYSFLRNRPEAEAQEIFNRIRASDDPISVLQFVKQGDLLLLNPPTTAGGTGTQELEQLEREAVQSSYFTVPSSPWTAIAGDGLVSELISSFFKWDDPFFYPFLDRDCFLEDMRKQNTKTAKYCSPFLVNAICAVRCFTSGTARKMESINGKNMTTQFLDEAKRFLELEAGRESLPTVQGLALIFTVSAYQGVDRAGSIYRYTAYDMLRRMQLEKRFAKLKDNVPSQLRDKIAISRALWGLFCFESIAAFLYLQLSLIRPPSIPQPLGRVFSKPSNHTYNVDLDGNTFSETSKPPPLVPAMFNANCQLSLILYEVMKHNADDAVELGSDPDLNIRMVLYAKLRGFAEHLPKHLQSHENTTPQTCFLRVYVNVVAFTILRPLQADHLFRSEQMLVKELLIRHCTFNVEAMENYTKFWPLTEYSCMAVCGLYTTAWTLVSFLDNEHIHDIFTRTCFMLRHTSRDFPMSRYILQGLKALAWALKKNLPPSAMACFINLGAGKEDLNDIPVAFIIPLHKQVQEMLGDDEDLSEIGGQLGILLSKWSVLSLQ